MTAANLLERCRPSRSKLYAALKEADPRAYRDAVNAAEAVIINHGLHGAAAVDVEATVVSQVAKVLGVKA